MNIDEQIELLDEVFASEKDMSDHYDRHNKDFKVPYETPEDYQKEADRIARLQKGLIGTDDEVWSFTENYLGDLRLVNYIVKTGDLVSYNLRRGASPDKLGYVSPFDIVLHTFHYEDMKEYKKTIARYFYKDNINGVMKCVKKGEIDKLKKHKEFLDDCGIDTSYLDKYL